MDEETSLTPLTKEYYVGLLEKDRGVWVYKPGDGGEAEVRSQRVGNYLEIIATPEAERNLDGVETGESLGTIPVEELREQDRQMEDEIITLDEGLKVGEARCIELKRQPPSPAKKLAKEVVALANLDGGVLILGAADDGSVYGLDDIEAAEAQLIDLCEEYIDPPIDIRTERRTRASEDLLVVRVPEATGEPYRFEGTAYTRSVHHTRELTEEELEEW